MDTRIWISPALCGCEIEIRGFFPAPVTLDAQGRKVDYMRPANWSEHDLRIENVCALHNHFRTDPLPFPDPYLGKRGRLALTTQTIPSQDKLPADFPPVEFVDPLTASEAERLYIQLYNEFPSGGLDKLDTCGCEIQSVFNADGASTILEHPVHTKRCQHHLTDADHSVALQENKDVMLAKAHFVRTFFKELSDVQIPVGMENLSLEELQAIEPTNVQEVKFKEDILKKTGEIYDRVSHDIDRTKSEITVRHYMTKFLNSKDLSDAVGSKPSEISKSIKFE